MSLTSRNTLTMLTCEPRHRSHQSPPGSVEMSDNTLPTSVPAFFPCLQEVTPRHLQSFQDSHHPGTLVLPGVLDYLLSEPPPDPHKTLEPVGFTSTQEPPRSRPCSDAQQSDAGGWMYGFAVTSPDLRTRVFSCSARRRPYFW